MCGFVLHDPSGAPTIAFPGDAPITTQSTFAQADIGADRRFVP